MSRFSMNLLSLLCCRPGLGGLLASSYRQHQESLAAERERRRLEREERLHRIEREERTRFRFMPFTDLFTGQLERSFSEIKTRPRLKFSFLTSSFCQDVFYIKYLLREIFIPAVNDWSSQTLPELL